MRNAIKDRLVIVGLVLAALLFVLCFVPSAHKAFESSLNFRPLVHMTLEVCLNLLWVLLAFCALAHWLAPSARRRCVHVRGLVTLVFVFSLLFPVISANDDLAQLDVLNDARTSQAIASALTDSKHLPVLAGVVAEAEIPAVQSTSSFATEFGTVCEPVQTTSVATPSNTTGNHSPPLS